MPKTNKKRNKTKRPRPRGAPINRGVPVAKVLPKVNASPRGFLVKHKEYVASITNTSASWSLLTTNNGNPRIRLNPADTTTFPWLSSIAVNFERYLFKKLHIIYETRCATTVSGAFQIGIDYDPSDASPTSEYQLLNCTTSMDVPPWKSFTLKLIPDSLHPQKQPKFTSITLNSAVGSTDYRTQDAGIAYIASLGDSAVFGKLFIEYEIELINPQLGPSVPATAYITDGGTRTISKPLGDIPNIFSTVAELYTTIDTAVNNKVTLPNAKLGSILNILYDVTGGTTGSSVPQFLTTTGLSVVNNFKNYSMTPATGLRDVTGGVYQVTAAAPSFYADTSASASAPGHTALSVTKLFDSLPPIPDWI